MDRLTEKNDLITKLIRMFSPILEIADRPADYDDQERARAVARLKSATNDFEFMVKDFSLGEAGFNYEVSFMKMSVAFRLFFNEIMQGNKIESIAYRYFDQSKSALEEIPVPPSSVILEAGSPFTAYCKLKELCASDVLNSIVWVDAYFDQSVFHRYLSSVKSDVDITLIIQKPNVKDGRGQKRFAEFIDISKLFAAEKGSQKYRLLVADSVHDRWLIVDGKRIYVTGGSAKDAAARDYFTISTVDLSEANLKRIQKLIDESDEWFGPAVTAHRSV